MGSFAGLGMPDGMIGTAWPSIHASFRVPVADLGLVLLAVTAGTVAVSAFTGRLLQRVGIGVLAALAAALSAAGALGTALTPGFPGLLAASVGLGLSAGLVDGGLNTETAMTGRLRLLNLLHGFYGVGSAAGPLVVTAAILAGSWRAAYAVLVLLEVMLALRWWAGRRRLGAPTRGAAGPDADADADATAAAAAAAAAAAGGSPSQRDGAVEQTRARDAGAAEQSDVGEAGAAEPTGAGGDPALDDRAQASRDGDAGGAPSLGVSRRRHASVALAAGMAVFFVYTGLEVAAGQWEATFCRLQLHLSASVTGLCVFSYWGALTATRFALGARRPPPPAARIVWTGLVAAVLATAMVWWRPAPIVAVAGFVVLGAALAGVFPALVLLTPGRLGPGRAQHAIAWEVGAAYIGGSGLSALIGLAIDRRGVGVLGAALAALAVLLLVCNAVLSWVAPAAGDGFDRI